MCAPPAPFKDRPEYKIAEKLAEDLADLLAPQSGAYYDVWLDGEKFASSVFEVSALANIPVSSDPPLPNPHNICLELVASPFN